MSRIEITIVKAVKQGENEMAQTYNGSIEGGANEFNRIREGLDKIANQILWDKGEVKTMLGEEFPDLPKMNVKDHKGLGMAVTKLDKLKNQKLKN